MERTPESEARRPLRSRGAWWARALASRLAVPGVTPNRISAAGLVLAAAGGACFLLSAGGGWPARAAWLVGAAACIQLRLFCNLLDGMVAEEGGLGTAAGEIWNDLPDRIADLILLLAAGIAVQGTWPWAPWLGGAAAAAALLVAYVRVLGAACGASHHFEGPAAKPHRMAALTGGALLAACLAPWGLEGRPLLAALALIVLAGLVTLARRLRSILHELAAAR